MRSEITDRLLANVSSVFKPPPFSPVGSLKIDEVHHELLEKSNGFYAFEGALHFFGTSGPPFHNMTIWNEDQVWRCEYRELAEGLTFFAENVLGDQFAYEEHGIVFFEAETGKKTLIAHSFEEFLSTLLGDLNYYSASSLLRDWIAAKGKWVPGYHLCPKMPFVLGGDFTVRNLYLLESFKSMRFKGDLAYQIKNTPDGTPFKLKITDSN